MDEQSTEKHRRELAKVLGYNPDGLLLPIWDQLLKDVAELVKDRKDLRTLRRILRG